MPEPTDLRVRFAIDDQALSELHQRAFGKQTGGQTGETLPWAQRLARHSLTWIGAFDRDVLVGFVHACWDGGLHAFVLDTAVDPRHQGHGLGRALARRLAVEAAAAGCEWLHVDFEPELATFYRETCGFEVTKAGLLHLGTG